MEIVPLLTKCFESKRTEIEPSILAYALLFSAKHVTGLLDIIEQLAVFWTEGDTKTKLKCMELLAQVVIPSQAYLDSDSVQAIITFAGKGLKDTMVANRSMDIFYTLINSEHIKNSEVIQLCDTLFNNVSVKKLSQNTRYKAFNILGKALEKCSLDIQKSKINFIEGFVNCMDGEKDPRNLLIAFQLIRTLIEKFDISQHVEDLFEIVFCYFPISFNAPNNDQVGITSEELKESLRKCLAATPYFGYYATPLLIEKLMNTTGSAKRDAMETISLCTPAYGAHVILPHAEELFTALVKEVYENTDITTVNIALQTIHNVVATLATGVSIANIRDPVEKSVESLLNKCVDKLSQPELKNARSAAHILRSAASASDPACTSVTHAVLPILYQAYNVKDPIPRQKAILDILIEILIASKTLYGSVENLGYDRDFQTPLLLYKQQVMQIFILSLIESKDEDITLTVSSLRGIHEMISMRQFLNTEEINITVNHLSRLLVSKGNQLKPLIISTLTIIAKVYPVVLGKHTFPMLFKQLPSETNVVNVSDFEDTLEVIQLLGIYPATFKIIIDSLVENLNYACLNIGTQNIEYVHAVAYTIFQLYKATSSDKEILQYGTQNLIPLIMKKCIESSPDSTTKCWYLDMDLVNMLAMIIAITVRRSNKSDQQRAVNDSFGLFISNNTLTANKMSSTHHPTPLLSTADVGNIDISILFTAIVANCYKDVVLPIHNLEAFLLEILNTIFNTRSDAKQSSLIKLLASITNRWANDEVISVIKKALTDHLAPLISSNDPTCRQPTFLVYIWFTKSLVIRNHRFGFELLDSLIELCHVHGIGREAAASFSTLLQEDELLLNKSANAVVSILFKQRMFNYCFNKLLQKLESVANQSEHEITYLMAIANMLLNIPNQIIVGELPKLMLPILRALSSNDKALILSMLGILQNNVLASTHVHNHLKDVIDSLLNLTHFPSIDVRMSSLECLKLLASEEAYDSVVHYKDLVIKLLAPALDDKKRVVRKKAVDCREQWYAIKKKSS